MESRSAGATPAVCALALAVAVALSACGGGGGSKSNPPATVDSTIGFTPTIANDSALTSVSPPTIATQAAARTLPTYSQHLEVIDAAGALGAGLQGSGVTIGLLDTGVNRNNPALVGRVTKNYVHVPDDGNDKSVDDAVGHGTVVAELAAGQPVGSWGGGVAQQATIVSSRIISDNPPDDDGSGEGNEIGAGQGYGNYFQALNAELANAGAKIINNSWGGLYWDDPALTTELDAAWRDFVVTRGGIVVFATGNEGSANPSDNAALPSLARDAALQKGWLAVTAVDPDNPTQLDRYVDSSGTTVIYPNACGTAMDYCLAAPGTEVFIDAQAKTSDSSYSLYKGSGTSFAAPLVSGAAAVVWSAFPYFSNDLVVQTLLGSAKDIGAPGVDPVFGWGLLDVSKAANGPSNFAWGDVSVSFSGTSVWRNPIIGAGGLVKAGSGTLTLAEQAAYTGQTRVQAGGLDIRKGLASDLLISSGATVWASGTLGGNVTNGGLFIGNAGTPASISGNLVQQSGGNLGLWLGSPLSVGGSATLAGQLSLLGVKSGYTTSAKETLLTAAGGVSGTFATVKAAPNVFLDASVSYAATSVSLDINRINVAKAVAGMGLSDITLVSATRLETAMDAIDGQLSSGSGGIGTGFITAAGQIQQVQSVAAADRSLRSLSGQLHATADAITFESLDNSRRTLSGRFAGLSASRLRNGTWYSATGTGSGQAPLGRFESSGWMMGNDVVNGASVFGFAFGESRAYGNGDTMGDHSRDRQVQFQAYAGTVGAHGYALAQVGAGQYTRWMRRGLVLGSQYAGVSSDDSGSFSTGSVETGLRLRAGRMDLVPYAGVDVVRLGREGFSENGADGFGLRTRGNDATRARGLVGMRAQQDWSAPGGRQFSAHASVEWQRTLADDGLVEQASFVGADAWAPLQGAAFGRQATVFDTGLDAWLGPSTALTLAYGWRSGGPLGGSEWSAQLRYGF